MYNFIRKIHIFCGLLLLLVACTVTAPSTKLPATPSELTGVQQIAFRAEDLGWPSDSYQQLPPWTEPLTKHAPVESLVIQATAISNPINPKTGWRAYHDLRNATQGIDVYANEATAIAVFEEVGSNSIFDSLPPGITFTSRVRNVIAGCHEITAFSSQGSAYNCNFIIQYGRYWSNVGMYVDNEVTTLEDFETLINIIQDRLIEQVNRETGS